MFRKTLIAAALAVATLASGTTSASAADLNNAITIEAPQSTETVQTAGFGKKFKFKFKRHYFKKHYGYNKCHWLKKKAYYTGSPYWWKKYKKCMYFTYY